MIARFESSNDGGPLPRSPARISKIPPLVLQRYRDPVRRQVRDNLVPRVSNLRAPWRERTGGGKIRDPGNEVGWFREGIRLS